MEEIRYCDSSAKIRKKMFSANPLYLILNHICEKGVVVRRRPYMQKIDERFPFVPNKPMLFPGTGKTKMVAVCFER